MTIHIINFTVLILVTLTLAVMQALKLNDKMVYAAASAQYTVLVYTNIFLLYLISRFVKEHRQDADQVKDPILGRKVPNIVLL